ncbi:MAG: DUF6586 family protein [Pseudomonadota bacterium]|nr:DUF6586 family protein [Pseudomonadota bacterium]
MSSSDSGAGAPTGQAKGAPEWRSVYQKLYFARVCLKALEASDAQAEKIAFRQSALAHVFSSLCSFMEFVAHKTVKQSIPLFSREALRQWEQTYPAIAEIQRLENAILREPVLLQLVFAVEQGLSAKPLQTFSAPSENELNLLKSEGQLADTQDIARLIQGMSLLEAFYDDCADALEEY